MTDRDGFTLPPAHTAPPLKPSLSTPALERPPAGMGTLGRSASAMLPLVRAGSAATMGASTTLTTASGRRRRRRKKRWTHVWPLAAAQDMEPAVRLSADACLARPPRFSFGYAMSASSARTAEDGYSNVNTDRLIVVENWHGHHEQAVFGIADGHGLQGAECATFVTAALPAVLQYASVNKPGKLRVSRSAKSGPSDAQLGTVMESVLTATVKKLHEALLESPVEATHSGTNLALCLLRGRRLVVGNVGACRVVVGRVVKEQHKDDSLFDCLPTFPKVPPLIESSLWYPTETNAEDHKGEDGEDGGGGGGGTAAVPPSSSAGASAGAGVGVGPESSSSLPSPGSKPGSSSSRRSESGGPAGASSSTAIVKASTAPSNTVLVTIPLAIDHRPDRPDEKIRIAGTGARVDAFRDAVGSSKALPRVMAKGASSLGPGLRFSRTLGASLGSECGVIPDPEIMSHVLQPEDRFIVLASDGVWDVMSSVEAVNVVYGVIMGVCQGGSGSVGKSATLTASAPPPTGPDAGLDDMEAGSTLSVVLPPISDPVAAHVHDSPAPTVQTVFIPTAPRGGPEPVTGMGAGTDAVLDLTHGILDGHVRKARLVRRRATALAASEAVLAEARSRWAALHRPHGGDDDLSCMVVLLDW